MHGFRVVGFGFDGPGHGHGLGTGAPGIREPGRAWVVWVVWVVWVMEGDSRCPRGSSWMNLLLYTFWADFHVGKVVRGKYVG